MNKLPKDIENRIYDILENTIIDGGYDYSKEDSWMNEEEAKDRIKNFIATILKEKDEAWIDEIMKRLHNMIDEYRFRECPMKGRMSGCTKGMCFHWSPSWEDIINIIKQRNE